MSLSKKIAALSSGTTTVSAGTLALGASNRLATTSSLALSGGTFALNTFDQSLTPLTLNASSTLSFGAGANLTFANSSSAPWTGTLTLTNYSVASNTLRFGTDSTGLTPTQLSLIRFADYGNTSAIINSLGYLSLSAIPEPSTYAALLGAAALLLAAYRKRRQ